MFSKEMIPILIEVIKSWEVIAVTIAIVIYFSLVSFVARTRSRSSSYYSKPKKQKPAKAAAVQEVSPSGDSNDELGLEEE